jgi:hypothetical protein
MLFGLIAFIGTGNAAVLITIDDQGHTATDVFDNQVYYHLEDDNLTVHIDLKTNMCSMFLHDNRVQIEGKCDEAQKDMEAAMTAMFSRQGMSREDMVAMRKMMTPHRPQDADIKPVAAETIAGYKAACYQMSRSRQMCISEAVTALISREFSFKKMVGLMGQWTEGPFGRDISEADKAEQKLREQGYVMKDINLKSDMPNAGLLQMLPEEMRRQMMDQLQQSEAKPTGRVVVKIEKNASFTPKMPDYPKKSIREFASLMMGR